MEHSLIDWLVVLTAGFLGGGLNAMAGGGSFLTLPALVYVGVPALQANATGTVALLPGYVSSTYGFREDLRPFAGVSVWTMSAVALAGGLIGALLLLLTPDALFRAVVPWLLLVATVLFAAGPWISRALRGGGARPRMMLVGTFVVAIYGGYFNGGLGILLLALYALSGLQDINAGNALKNLISAVLTTIAVAAYAVGGAVRWEEAAGMVVAVILGGYVGARLARRIPGPALRVAITAVGIVMTVAFFQ